jgi:hypothetical protein
VDSLRATTHLRLHHAEGDLPDNEVEDDEGRDHLEGNKVQCRLVRPGARFAAHPVPVARVVVLIAEDVATVHVIVHDLRPVLHSGAAEERDEGVAEVAEVQGVVAAEEAHAEDGVNVEEEELDDGNPEHGLQALDQPGQDNLQLLQEGQNLEHTQHAQQPKHHAELAVAGDVRNARRDEVKHVPEPDLHAAGPPALPALRVLSPLAGIAAVERVAAAERFEEEAPGLPGEADDSERHLQREDADDDTVKYVVRFLVLGDVLFVRPDTDDDGREDDRQQDEHREDPAVREMMNLLRETRVVLVASLDLGPLLPPLELFSIALVHGEEPLRVLAFQGLLLLLLAAKPRDDGGLCLPLQRQSAVPGITADHVVDEDLHPLVPPTPVRKALQHAEAADILLVLLVTLALQAALPLLVGRFLRRLK